MLIIKRVIILLSISLLGLSACEPDQKYPKINSYKFERYTLGTFVQLQFYSQEIPAKSFISQFDQLSEQDTQDLYAWGNGWLVQQNRYLEKAQCGLAVDTKTINFFKRMKQLHVLSDGLFDPTIMPLVELWGFHDSQKMRSSPPNKSEIDTLRNRYGNMQNLVLNNKSICSTQTIKIDLGAIAKGWFAEKTINLLKANNINNALIGFGGDLIAIGKKADGNSWRVGLKNPNIHWEGFNAPAVFDLRDSNNLVNAVFTSGDYEREFEHEGKRSHHILDPRTGYPNTEVRSVTVIHSDPILADAAATALHVAGKDWQNVAKKMQVNKVLVLFPNKRAQITGSLSEITTWLDDEYTVELIH